MLVDKALFPARADGRVGKLATLELSQIDTEG